MLKRTNRRAEFATSANYFAPFLPVCVLRVRRSFSEARQIVLLCFFCFFKLSLQLSGDNSVTLHYRCKQQGWNISGAAEAPPDTICCAVSSSASRWTNSVASELTWRRRRRRHERWSSWPRFILRMPPNSPPLHLISMPMSAYSKKSASAATAAEEERRSRATEH